MPELKSCPFCGGEAENRSYHSCDCCGKPYNGRILCKLCGAEVSHFDTDGEAIAAWNRRTPSAAVPDPVAYLVESKNDPTIRWVQFTPEVPDGVSATVSNLYRYAPPAAVPDGYLDDIAARLWKAEAEDSGTPKSVVSGRTREAFDDQDVELKNRWRKFARAAISAAPAAPTEASDE